MPAIHSLLVALHGVGSSGADLLPLANRLAALDPGTEVWAPDAPNAFDGGPSGRQWFSIRGVTPANRPARIQGALPPLWAAIDARLAALGLGREALRVVGFSQGAILALAMAVDADPPAVVVSFAGRLAVDARKPPRSRGAPARLTG